MEKGDLHKLFQERGQRRIKEDNGGGEVSYDIFGIF
jgi:hypothetical protein